VELGKISDSSPSQKNYAILGNANSDKFKSKVFH